MLRRVVFFAFVVLGVMLIGAIDPIWADGPNAWSVNQVNLRTGPGTQYETITAFPANTPFILEARNRDTSWVVVRTVDNTARGWVKTTLLKISPEVGLFKLPFTETIFPNPNAKPTESLLSRYSTDRTSRLGCDDWTSLQESINRENSCWRLSSTSKQPAL